jgi:hypothetical protein
MGLFCTRAIMSRHNELECSDILGKLAGRKHACTLLDTSSADSLSATVNQLRGRGLAFFCSSICFSRVRWASR